MRTYRVLVTNGRTFQTFTDKQKAIDCARNCFDLGFDDVYVGYGNGNPVPKTPAYAVAETRELGKPYTIVLMEEAAPHREVQRFKADKIVAVSDKNKIDHDFYREFWLNGVMTGRYPSKEFYFDFGKDYWEGE